MSRSGRPSHLVVVAVAVVAVLLAACGGPETVAWRDLELTVPDGWVVFDEADTRLGVANEPIGSLVEEEDRPEGDVAAVFFTHRPGVTPGEWRTFIEDSGATLEVDQATEVGGVPATRLQFLTPARDGAAETREMVIVVPAREVEVLAQPVPRPGDERAAQVFDEALPTFEELLASVRWGAPTSTP